ncbi:MAG: DUF1232 domain-containing protein [Candidatus Limnocylindrales bacterium]
MDLSLILGIVVGIVLLWALILVLLLLFRPKGVPLRELIRVVPDVMRLLRSIIGDRSTPLDVRAVLVLLLVWIISPIDLIPEFIPVLGPLDDVVVAAVALRYTRRRLGIEALRRQWAGSDEGFALLVRMVGTG